MGLQSALSAQIGWLCSHLGRREAILETHLYTCLLLANRLFKEAPQGVEIYSDTSYWEKEKAEGQDQSEKELRSPKRFHMVLTRPPYMTGWSVMGRQHHTLTRPAWL